MPAVVRWDPYRDVTALRDEMNRLYSRTVGDARGPSSWTPAMDVFDHEDAIVLKVELPGLAPEDIHIEVDDNVLTLKGERRFSEDVDEGRYYRLERAYGEFQRSLTLPQTAKTDEITAHADDGVLEVRVPKAQEVKPRRIAVGQPGE